MVVPRSAHSSCALSNIVYVFSGLNAPKSIEKMEQADALKRLDVQPWILIELSQEFHHLLPFNDFAIAPLNNKEIVILGGNYSQE